MILKLILYLVYGWHVLGLENNVVKFATTETVESSDVISIDDNYVMDSSFGLNFLNINCDKIMPVQMGFVYKENLLVCPVELPDPEKKK